MPGSAAGGLLGNDLGHNRLRRGEAGQEWQRGHRPGPGPRAAVCRPLLHGPPCLGAWLTHPGRPRTSNRSQFAAGKWVVELEAPVFHPGMAGPGLGHPRVLVDKAAGQHQGQDRQSARCRRPQPRLAHQQLPTLPTQTARDCSSASTAGLDKLAGSRSSTRRQHENRRDAGSSAGKIGPGRWPARQTHFHRSGSLTVPRSDHLPRESPTSPPLH